ncbi:MAG: hypothetical protein ACE5G0_17750, partial [Rhodothermales bacterium]
MAHPNIDRTTKRFTHGGGRLLRGILFFALAIGLTWGGRVWHLARVADTVQTRQEAVVSDALALIEQQFDHLQQDLLAQAKTLAEAAPVIEALRERTLGEQEASSESLIHYFADLSLPERWAVELYDATLELVAWNGFSLPRDEAPETAHFLETFHTTIAEDSDWRQALVVWYPVRDDVRVLGAVRVMRVLQVRAPIQNQYLQHFSMSETWSRTTRLPVVARFQRPFEDRAPVQGQARLLQGADGTLLGRVVVEPPSAERLMETNRQRFDDVLAFWATLLLCWLTAGLWVWYRAAESPDDTGRGRRLRSGIRLGVVMVVWWGVRYALLAFDVPGRWQRGKAPLAPLFDPSHLASTFGGGLMRSTGDFFVTAVFCLLFALAFLDYATRFRRRGASLFYDSNGVRRSGLIPSSPWRWLTSLSVTVLLAFGLTLMLAFIARHTVLDSTLDFFSREGLFPESLVLLIFCTLLLFTLSVVMLIVGVTWMALHYVRTERPRTVWPPWVLGLGTLLLAGGLLAGLYVVFEVQGVVQWTTAVLFLIVGVGLAVVGFSKEGSGLGLLTLRSVLPAILALSILLYPMLHSGLDEQQRLRMEDAAESFDKERDPAVLFAIREVLEEAQREPSVRLALSDTATYGMRRAYLDSLATVMLRSSLLSSLGAYDVSLVFLDAEGLPAGRYDATDQSLSGTALDQSDAEQFGMLQQMYAESGVPGALVEPLTGRLDPNRFQYAGLVPVGDEVSSEGWIMARAEQHDLLQEGSTPFLRVLLP